jgi:hypothetical protein
MQNDLIIYMATHNQKCSYIDDYIVPIQVGKALSEEKIETVGDDTGDNISLKNGVFCELTALYWMWKNTNHKYIGLYHYRRRFNLNKDEITSIINDNIILPKKKKFRMSLEQQYIKEHGENDWNVMIEALKECYPEYYKFSEKVFKNNVLYMFNMFVMNKEVFNKYCEWIFPMLFKIEERLKSAKKNNYQKRYAGFMAERLFTLYVQYNKFDIFEANVLFMNSKVKFVNAKNTINDIIFESKILTRRK